jgi:hypothetical protein
LPADDKAGKVTVKLIYSDFIWWPLLVVTAGVLTGFWINRQIGVAIPGDRLRTKLSKLQRDYTSAVTSFRKSGTGTTWVDSAIDEAFAKAEAALAQRVADLRGSSYVKIPDETTKKLDEDIQKVAGQLAGFDALGAALRKLEDKVKSIETTRKPHLPAVDVDTPYAADELRASLLKKWTFDDLAAIEGVDERVKQATADVGKWEAIETDMSGAQKDINDGRGEGKDAASLDLCERTLHGFYDELLDQTTVEEAANGANDDNLADAVEELRRQINLIRQGVVPADEELDGGHLTIDGLNFETFGRRVRRSRPSRGDAAPLPDSGAGPVWRRFLAALASLDEADRRFTGAVLGTRRSFRRPTPGGLALARAAAPGLYHRDRHWAQHRVRRQSLWHNALGLRQAVHLGPRDQARTRHRG